MNTIILNAEVLAGGRVLQGKVCPIVHDADYVGNGSKSRMAVCCKSCWDGRKQEARQAVLAALRAADLAGEAWERNQATNAEAAEMPTDDTLVVRQRLSKPVLANLKVGNSAVIRKAKDSGLEYLDYQLPVAGGFISVYVFGAKLNVRGKAITGLVEIKSKQRNGIDYRYLRVEAISGVNSDVDLKLRPFGQTDGFVAELPSVSEEVENGKEAGETRYMKFAIGFVPVKTKVRETAKVAESTDEGEEVIIVSGQPQPKMSDDPDSYPDAADHIPSRI